MIWKDYSNKIRAGSHAPFSASSYSWLNYDADKAVEYIKNMKAKERGTILHAHAASCIKLRTPLGTKDTIGKYVNDCIKMGMTPEVLLYYSPYFFGTTDAINIDKNGRVRISDLKTGVTPASIKQLYIYDALYCLDYNVNPLEVDHELRIYQNNEIFLEKPKGKDIMPIINKIQQFDSLIRSLPEGELL